VSTNETFARYRVGRLLGRGGMAVVHEASLAGHDGFVRKVALKRVRAENAGDPELARLFADEARIASHLHHANLVGVLDFGVHEGVAYQALELVSGTTLEALREHLAASGRSIPEEIALHIVREVAHGLAYAHRATDENGKVLGLVHRDVSPSNVLVGFHGDVKLTDFGIAFARRKRVETAHGVTRGKPSYMAPEQATKGTLDARTDLFALGCTLHFALTGRSPLEGDEVLMKLLVGEPAPLDPSLPEDLRSLIASAVSPEKRERPASAEVFAERLDVAYRARADRDGRAALRAWLTPLAKELRSAVIEEPSEAATTPDRSVQDAPVARPAEVGEASAERPAPEGPPASRRVRVVLAGLGLLGATLFAIEAWSLLRTPSVEVSADRSPDDAVPSDAGHDAASDPDAGSGPDATTMPAPLENTEARVARRPDVGPLGPDVPLLVTQGQSTEAPVGEGWLRIVAGCERARDGEVWLDGRRLGEHVPTTARISAGRHSVRVDAPSGERFEGTLEVSSFHTESRPAWFRACE